MKVNKKNKPLVKYPGGKGNELHFIKTRLPLTIERYFEPFLGGGSVFFNINNDKCYINDKSTELISFYRYVGTQNKTFLKYIEDIQHNWDVMSGVIDQHANEIKSMFESYRWDQTSDDELKVLIHDFVRLNADEFNGMMNPDFNIGIDSFVNELQKSFYNKLKRMKKIEIKLDDTQDSQIMYSDDVSSVTTNTSYKKLTEQDVIKNIESAFKSAFYNHFRFIYNNLNKFNIKPEFAIAIYFFIREYCFSSMFRYSPDGNFNVPYGGISYNRKSMNGKLSRMKSDEVVSKISNATISCDDYMNFLNEHMPRQNDFIFLDPPYDSSFSTYAKNSFGESEHRLLSEYLKERCDAQFMLVIKETPLIESLYRDRETISGNRVLKIEKIKIKYFVSFMNRNTKETTHLIITNY